MKPYLALLALVGLVLAVILGLAGFNIHAAPPPEPAPKEAAAGLVWTHGTMELRLTDKPCPFDDEREQLESEGIPPARLYVVTQGGQKRSGCWVKDMGGDVTTLKPGDREVGTIPLEWFTRPPAS